MPSDRLSTLAEAVADQAEVDWAEAESSAGDAEEMAVVSQLRAVASVSRAARRLIRRWGPFELRNELGGGTFGTVYRAWDPRVGRDVALKLLHDAAGDVQGRDGVIAEARLLAGVEHPSIVPVYGADVHDGTVGIWTRLVDGKNLKEILVEQGPLGANEAAEVGRVLCQALAAVHHAGLLHRDIKPQNVMREVGGRLMLMDFGAANAAPSSLVAMRGTPAYLAPEVIAGGAPSPRSDIYSLGVLLYHLTSGEFPVVGATWEDLRELHRSGKRRALVDVRPDLPAWFRAVVERASHLNPDARPATAGELEALLRQGTPPEVSKPHWRAIAALLFATLATGAAWWLSRPQGTASMSLLATSVGSPRPASPQTRIGVLPIRNLTGDARQDYAAAGLTELLIAHLSRVPGVTVPSSEGTAPLVQAGQLSPEAIGSMGVNLLLAGSIARTGSRLHLTVRLVDPVSRQTIWGEEVSRASDSVLEAAAQVVGGIGRQLRPGWSAATVAVRAQRPRAAEEAFLRGLAEVNTSLDDRLPSAVAHFRRAVEVDPSFAEGWAELALADQRAIERRDPRQRAALAEDVRQTALMAIRLDPGLPTAHVALGVVQFHHDWDFAAAEQSFRRAIDLVPANAYARTHYAWLLAAMGRLDAALAEAQEARLLEPLVAARYTTLGMVRYYARDYAGSLNDLQRALELSPGYPLAYLCIGRVLNASGDPEGAIAAIDRALAGGSNVGWLWVRAEAQARAARVDEVTRTQNEIEQQVRAGRFASIDNAAYVAIARGNHNEAFPLLEEAVRRRMTNVLWLAVDPRVDALRATPRFAALLDQITIPR